MIRNLLKFAIILGLLSVASGGGVAVIYGCFKGRLDDRTRAEKKQGIQAVCPDGATVDPERPLVGEPYTLEAVYAAGDAEGRTVAYVASGAAGGYSSTVQVIVGVRAEDFAVLRVVVVSQAETPGLGTQVAETRSNFTLWEKLFGPSEAGKTECQFNGFLDRFQGKKAGEIPNVQGITAATISSNATKKAIAEAVERAVRAAKGNPS